MKETTHTDYKIIIVGGGPAGLATALHIARQSPALAAETLILEVAEHPRPKLCGGGVTFHGEEQLQRLGLQLDVPSFIVNRLVFRLGGREFAVSVPQAMRVIQRDEFDAALAGAVAESGVALQANERLLDLQLVAGGAVLTTSRARYRAAVVVGTDGANSTVRRKLRLFDTASVARLLRLLTPIDPQDCPAWREQTAVFDFSCAREGIQGYVWDFPCLIDGEAYMNRGIFDSRIAPQQGPRREPGHLWRVFAAGLQERQVDVAGARLEGHPVRWFNPQGEFARPHVLLAGDAAGVDPLFAEGISYGMEYGEIVAATIRDAFARGDFSFADYRPRLLEHRLGRLLRRRAAIATHFYRHRYPRLWPVVWRLAAVAPLKMQRAVGASVGLLAR